MDASHYLQFAIMIPYFQLVPEQQCDVLAESQDQLGLPALFLEKDYWVCRVLDMLFENKTLENEREYYSNFVSKAEVLRQQMKSEIEKYEQEGKNNYEKE